MSSPLPIEYAARDDFDGSSRSNTLTTEEPLSEEGDKRFQHEVIRRAEPELLAATEHGVRDGSPHVVATQQVQRSRINASSRGHRGAVGVRICANGNIRPDTFGKPDR